jgi:hypothetical protein
MCFVSFLFAAAAVPSGALAAVEIIPADQAAKLEAAGGPQQDMDAAFTFSGKSVAPASAVKRGLACFEDDQPVTRCYTGMDSLSAAETVLTPRASAARLRARGSKRARAAFHAGDPLTVWMGQNYTGASLSLSSSCAWYNLTGTYDNNVESSYAGNHSYYLSELSGGGGTVGSGAAYSSTPTFYAWNNFWSSRWRRGC